MGAQGMSQRASQTLAAWVTHTHTHDRRTHMIFAHASPRTGLALPTSAARECASKTVNIAKLLQAHLEVCRDAYAEERSRTSEQVEGSAQDLEWGTPRLNSAPGAGSCLATWILEPVRKSVDRLSSTQVAVGGAHRRQLIQVCSGQRWNLIGRQEATISTRRSRGSDVGGAEG